MKTCNVCGTLGNVNEYSVCEKCDNCLKLEAVFSKPILYRYKHVANPNKESEAILEVVLLAKSPEEAQVMIEKAFVHFFTVLGIVYDKNNLTVISGEGIFLHKLDIKKKTY